MSTPVNPLEALEAREYGREHPVAGIELVRRGLELMPQSEARSHRAPSDVARAAVYADDARAYERDATYLAALNDEDRPYALVYAAIAGARWVAAVAALLGARRPLLLSTHEVLVVRGGAA